MQIGILLIMVVYGVIGGISTLAMVFGIPAIIGWKIYRKVKFHISLMN